MAPETTPTTEPTASRPTPNADALLRRLIELTAPSDWAHRLARDLMETR